jgi:N-acyl-D-amino-acid deacylase
MPDYDLIISNGNLLDGTGRPAARGDLGVRAGRIAIVGEVSGSGTREIDAAGRVVAPGFIDVHAHDDAAAVNQPQLDFKIMQGVTTDVVGNCGAGVAPANDRFRSFFARGFGGIVGETDLPWRTTAEYFAAVDAARPACNVAAYAPHGVIRSNVMGMDRREPSDSELDEMCALVEEAMQAGAIGMSTGLIYPPGAFARTPELVKLASVAARYGGIYTSHIRNEGEGLIEAIEEALAIGEQSGCPVQLSHHKSAGVPGGTKVSLAHVAAARGRGMDVTVDVYPYTASSSFLAAMFRVGREEAFERSPAIIASVKYNKDRYEGKYLSDIARDLDLPIGDAVRRILQEEEDTPSVIMFIMDEDDVRRVAGDRFAMVGSDGLPTGGKPHPRLYGTMAAFIQKYVRESPVMTLEEAVRKMTSLPATKHRIHERGVLRPGWHADVVVFDAEEIADVATYAEPRQYPRGIEYVIVNGQVAVEDGVQTDARAGRMLRRDA